MKTPTAIILFGLVAATLAQYGIPDDDDVPPVRAPNPAFYVSHYQGPSTQNVVTVPKVTPTEQFVKVEPQLPIAAAIPPLAKLSVTTPQVIEVSRPAFQSTPLIPLRVAESSPLIPLRVTESSPLIPLRVTGKSFPLPNRNVNVPVHRIEFRDDSLRA